MIKSYLPFLILLLSFFGANGEGVLMKTDSLRKDALNVFMGASDFILKEIATQFEYWTSFGISYTFGSIYNNVVNPRFGNHGSGGGTMIIY